MNIFLLFAYGTAVLLSAVLFLSVWIVASNVVYVHIEKKNQIIRKQLENLVINLYRVSNEPNRQTSFNNLSDLISRHRKLISGVLAEITQSNAEISRAQLINALNNYGLPSIAQRELKNLKSFRRKKRLWAAANLTCLAPAELIIAPLRTALTDNDSSVRLAAAQALSTSHCAESACEIIENLSSEKTIPWTRIVELMPSLGKAAIAPLALSLESEKLNADQCAITLASLGILQATQAEQLIAKHLVSQNKHIRIQAAKALGNLPAKSSTPALLTALVDREWEVRVVCAHALGNIADPSAGAGLFTHLGDPVYWVRYNSADALSKMGVTGTAYLERGLTSQDPFARDTSQLILNRAKHLQIIEDEVVAC